MTLEGPPGAELDEALPRGELATRDTGRPVESVADGDTYSPATLAEIGVILEMARCLREIAEGRWPE